MKFIFPTFLILVAIGIFFLVTDPLYKNISTLRTEVAAYDTALTHSTDLQKRRDSLLATYTNIAQADKTRLEHFLPSSVNNIELILEIEQIATVHMLQLKNIKFESPKADATAATTTSGVPAAGAVNQNALNSTTPYGVFQLEFSTDATYEDFVLFLRDLEHNLRIIDVRSINFSVPQVTAGSKSATVNPNVYTYVLKVDTYWLK